MYSYKAVWNREQVPSQEGTFPGRKGTCDGIKEVRDPMQGIFSVSASNETIDSADSSGTLVGLVYMLHK